MKKNLLFFAKNLLSRQEMATIIGGDVYNGWNGGGTPGPSYNPPNNPPPSNSCYRRSIDGVTFKFKSDCEALGVSCTSVIVSGSCSVL